MTKVLEILQNVNQSYSLDKLSCRIFVHKCITLEVTYFLAGYNLLYLGEVHWGEGGEEMATTPDCAWGNSWLCTQASPLVGSENHMGSWG